jgi:hypothetical protein
MVDVVGDGGLAVGDDARTMSSSGVETPRGLETCEARSVGHGVGCGQSSLMMVTATQLVPCSNRSNPRNRLFDCSS